MSKPAVSLLLPSSRTRFCNKSTMDIQPRTSSLFLFIVVVVACLGICVGRVKDRILTCPEQINFCTDSFSVYIEQEVSLGHDINIESVCRDWEDTLMCMGDCENLLKEAIRKPFMDLLAYMCHENRREDMDKVASTSCLIDGSLPGDIERLTLECKRKHLKGGAETEGCQDVEDTLDCLLDGVNVYCDEYVAPTIEPFFAGQMLVPVQTKRVSKCIEEHFVNLSSHRK